MQVQSRAEQASLTDTAKGFFFSFLSFAFVFGKGTARLVIRDMPRVPLATMLIQKGEEGAKKKKQRGVCIYGVLHYALLIL